jgi:hypothetical protein
LIVPFLTTVADTGDYSTHPIGHDYSAASLLHMFRRLVWIGAKDPALIRQQASKFSGESVAPDVATLGAIMTPLLSMQMDWDA